MSSLKKKSRTNTPLCKQNFMIRKATHTNKEYLKQSICHLDPTLNLQPLSVFPLGIELELLTMKYLSSMSPCVSFPYQTSPYQQVMDHAESWFGYG